MIHASENAIWREGARALFETHAGLADLAIEHLQLPISTTQTLRALGICTLADLVGDIGEANATRSECVRAGLALSRLVKVDADWYAYWKMNDFQFHHLAATCSELRNLSPAIAAVPLGRHNFGNGGARIALLGHATVGDMVRALAVGLPDVPGMGARKTKEFFHVLLAMIDRIRAGAPSLALTANPSVQEDVDQSFPVDFALPEEVSCLPISILHLGHHARSLEKNGIGVVDEVISACKSGLDHLFGIGVTAQKRVHAALFALQACLDSAGGLDLEAYCRSLSLRLLPETCPLPGPEAFLDEVQSVLLALVAGMGEPVLDLILSKRILAQPEDRASLADIANQAGISRERVRQREEKLIALLSHILIRGDHLEVKAHVREEHLRFWREIARIMSALGENPKFQVIERSLAEAWGLPVEKIVPHTSLFFRVMTGALPFSSARGEPGVDHLRPLLDRPEVATLPLAWFQIGRGLNVLEEKGMRTVADLISALIDGRVQRRETVLIERATALFDQVAEFSKDGTIDLQAYLDHVNVPIVPCADIVTPQDFINTLNDAIEVVVTRSCNRSKSLALFRSRISMPLSKRITTLEFSKAHGIHAASAKAEESLLLRRLRDMLPSGNNALAHVHFRPAFVRYWADVEQAFDAGQKDPKSLGSILAEMWHLEGTEIDPVLPTLVAVMSGRPFGRLARGKATRPNTPHKSRRKMSTASVAVVSGKSPGTTSCKS